MITRHIVYIFRGMIREALGRCYNTLFEGLEKQREYEPEFIN